MASPLGRSADREWNGRRFLAAFRRTPLINTHSEMVIFFAVKNAADYGSAVSSGVAIAFTARSHRRAVLILL